MDAETMSNPYLRNPELEFEDVESLSDDEAEAHIEALREALEFHDHRYYVDNDPVVSDRAYDQLFKRLQDLEDAFPEFQSETSPTRRVGAEPLDELEEIEHTAPMLSLDAALEPEEIADFEDFLIRNAEGESFTYYVEPKFDGLSVEIVYDDGEFQYAATRGDGRVGEDISENVKTIPTIPMHLRDDAGVPDRVAVRGEIFMPKSGFQELNKRRIESGDDPFANPRNAAAGTVRQLDPGVVADRPLDAFFYDVLTVEGETFESQHAVRDALVEWGLKTDEHTTYCDDVDEVETFYEQIVDERESLDYEIDGVVIKVNEFDVREILGERSRSPRWAIAWKFPPKKEVTTLRDIIVQVGRTGRITPVAMLDPVDVDGVTVARASLHNVEEVHDKDVRVGDVVRIQRAGDVIPDVVEVVEPGGEGERAAPFEMPETCPVCETELVREGPLHFCPAGLACRAQLEGHLIHFASRDAMDVEGLGERTVDQLLQHELVADIADLYTLDPEDFLQLELFAETSANNLYEAIQHSDEARLDRFLHALGIRLVGRHVAELIAEALVTLDAVRGATVDELQSIEGVGPEIARSVRDFFDDDQNNEVVDRLLETGFEVHGMPTDEAREQPFDGETFVFTGSLDDYTRREAQDMVEALGGRATSSVSGNTDYLVAGDNPGGKLDEARDRGTEIWDEEEFRSRIEPHV
jgi:DNA ligase (NAD+)